MRLPSLSVAVDRVSVPTGSPAGRRSGIAFAALAAAIATFVFLRPWWNRHLGLSLDGYMPLYGHLILDGKIPYRDFFLHLPPLQPLAEAALEAIFGRSIFAVRVAGALGRVALAAVTAAWMARHFRPATAAAAAFAGVCLVSSDDTEILDLYTQWSLLGAILSGWLASMALDRGQGRRLLWLAAGMAAAAAIWTKQTVGLGATVAVPLALLLFAVRGREERPLLLRECGGFALGWLLPGVAIGSWLAGHGAWRLFLEAVFVGAASSKGPPSELILRPFLDPFRLTELIVPASIAVAVALVAFLAVRARVGSRASPRGERVALLLTLIGLLAVVAAGFELPSHLPSPSSLAPDSRTAPAPPWRGW